jgi:hypothetical protein
VALLLLLLLLLLLVALLLVALLLLLLLPLPPPLPHLPRWHCPYQNIRRGCPIHDPMRAGPLPSSAR